VHAPEKRFNDRYFYLLFVLTILHLSDLHRSQNAPVSNDMLLSCLLLDLEKQGFEDPVIHACDVAVITGDIIMGAPVDDTNVSETLTKQYREAKDFLIQLSEELFDGDLSRIFVVPGNHDVCWQICKQSMERVETDGRMGLLKLLEGENSPYRWSWEEQMPYRIRDFGVYKSRLKYFKDFFDDLYKEQGYKFSLEDNEQVINFVTTDQSALFTGFSSLYGNDCYDHRGRIFGDNVAKNGLWLRKSDLVDIPLKIAFWHHSLESSEYGVNHLNRNEVLPLLIDQGYVLGLHGHQHRSSVVSFGYHLDPERFMPVISCGSLCANPYSIPPGYRRQYNLIEIDEIDCEAKIHVREWFDNTSLTSAKLQEFGGKSWTKKDLPLLREITKRQVHVLENVSPALDKAELYIRERKFEAALELLRKLPQNIPIVRRLLIESLHTLGKWDDLIGLISRPLNPDELSIVVDALCRKADFNRANLVITECERDTLTYDRGFIDALRKRVEAEKEVAIRRE
jgi:predicted MPP superfamily phosphohydrolase